MGSHELPSLSAMSMSMICFADSKHSSVACSRALHSCLHVHPHSAHQMLVLVVGFGRLTESAQAERWQLSGGSGTPGLQYNI